MQTFLPHSDFAKAMSCLDDSRLGNQVYREGITILRGGWSNHPASRMWSWHKPALALYLLAGVHELSSRGRQYWDRPWYAEIKSCLPDDWSTVEMPAWLGDERLHSSHRAALLYKRPSWYNQFGWTEQPGLNYWWPS